MNGPRINPLQIQKWVQETLKGNMSEEELCLRSKRQPSTVKKWLGNKRANELERVCLELDTNAYNTHGEKRRIAPGSGIKSYLPSLYSAFLVALEKVIQTEKKKAPFFVCLSTFRQLAIEIYPKGNAEPEVRSYINAFFQKSYERKRRGKTQTVVSRPNAEHGRTLLQRVLTEGMFAMGR